MRLRGLTYDELVMLGDLGDRLADAELVKRENEGKQIRTGTCVRVHRALPSVGPVTAAGAAPFAPGTRARYVGEGNFLKADSPFAALSMHAPELPHGEIVEIAGLPFPDSRPTDVKVRFDGKVACVRLAELEAVS